MSEVMAGKVCEKSLTLDNYGSNNPSPKCQFEDGKFKSRSLQAQIPIIEMGKLSLFGVFVIGKAMMKLKDTK